MFEVRSNKSDKEKSEQLEQKASQQKTFQQSKGFSKLDQEERWKKLISMSMLTAEDVEFLKKGSPLHISLAENFIENVIGYFPMSLGVATHFVIDGRPVMIPMAVEESSIIAAASKSAKWIQEFGYIETEILGENIIGQIQISKCKDFLKLKAVLEKNKLHLMELANKVVAPGLVRRGGGVNDLKIRKIHRPDGLVMAVVHVSVNPCDAMGANIVNQICEYLKTPLEEMTGETVTMCILSNLSDSKITRAKVTLEQIDPALAEKIEEGSLFSQLDPYRAATNNKGVLNGIDPILIATGNDWRAVEAGVHAYASREGSYKSLTRWKREGKKLIGIFEAPISVGVVGGVTRLHPVAKMSLKMMGVEKADDLSRICAGVGLVTNLGAIRALTTVGIIEGHMKLHIKNLALGAGAKEKEARLIQKKLEKTLSMTKRISLTHAIEALRELRKKDQPSLGGGTLQPDQSGL